MKKDHQTTKPKTYSLDEVFGALTPAEEKIAVQEVKYYFLVQAIKKMRDEFGFTQQVLAQKAQLPRTTITKIESGNYNPTIETLTAIAGAFGKELKISFE